MSGVPPDHESRLQDIQRGLEFIESTLPFPGPSEQYNEFIQNLVMNLFEEGNCVYSEGDWTKSLENYTEALNVADYAASEEIPIHSTALEKLHANRAAAYLNIGVYDEALRDCEEALQLNADNHRALYRKARCLKEMGRQSEAYESIAKCLLAVPQDPSVVKLTEELAKFLGLKIRKPYVRRKPAINVLPGSSSSSASSEKSFKETESVEDIELAPQPSHEMSGPLLAPNLLPQPPPSQKGGNEAAPLSSFTSHNATQPPVSLPLLANGGVTGATVSFPVPRPHLGHYDSQIIGSELDSLLDIAAPGRTPGTLVSPPPGAPAADPVPDPFLGSSHASHAFGSLSKPPVNFAQLCAGSGSSVKPEFDLASFPSALDSLDSISITEVQTVPQPSQEMGGPLLAPSLLPQPPLSQKGGNEAAPLSSFTSHNATQPPVSLPLLANGGVTGATVSFPVPRPHLGHYDSQIIGSELDSLLDIAAPGRTPGTLVSPPPGAPAADPVPDPFLGSSHVSHAFSSLSKPPVNFAQLCAGSGSSVKPEFDLTSFPSALDSLDSISITEVQTGALDFGQTFSSTCSNDKPQGAPSKMGFNIMDGQPAANTKLSKIPLLETHEFRQACSVCFVKVGPRLLDYTLLKDGHKCKKDLLLGRLKNAGDHEWKLIRPRPTKNQYVGPYYICKDVAGGGECKYPSRCTFAYCQEEIDVWTLERKGFIIRDMLVDPQADSMSVSVTVSEILREHPGMFMFLCEDCFDNKPRIISKTSRNNPALCSNPTMKHVFDDRRCLVHASHQPMQEGCVSYSKIRPYNPLCHMDMCWHEVRYGCSREDSCFFAHSLVELKVWIMQSERGISSEAIVHESSKYWNMESRAPQPSVTPKFGPPNLNIRFVCSQCWRNGQIIEADKNRKYCAAKARHPWTKDKRAVLAISNEHKKWKEIRPFPTKKPIPFQFEICLHVASGKKCQYVGVCSFAHSPEERDLWTFMKDRGIADFDQLHEQWLRAQKPGSDEEAASQPARDTKRHIHMPTDYAEEVAGNHCWLCGKHCNSEKQWQQHITSKQHKDRVFNSEDDQDQWQYRFPTGTFKMCERYEKGICPHHESCTFAHGKEELEEWLARRTFLLTKLAKVKKDRLIAPNDNDFGKYSFMLKEINIQL